MGQLLKGVIFDLDDTLYAYEEANRHGTNAVISYLSNHLHVDSTVVQQAIKRARQINHETIPTQGASHSRLLYIQKAIEYLTGKTDFALNLFLEDLFRNTFMDNMCLENGVLDCFKLLKNRGLKIVILTDLTAQIQHKKIIRLGIQNYIDYLVTSEEAGVEKPDPKIFHLALSKAGLAAHEMVMVGDNYAKDILGARGVGISGLYHKVDPILGGYEDSEAITFSDFFVLKEYISSILY